MKPGSVVVDLAADSGGNVEGAEPGAVVQIGGVQVWGGANVPSQMPAPASRLYAQNVLNVIMLMTREGAFSPDFDDEIVAAMCVVRPAGRKLDQWRVFRLPGAIRDRKVHQWRVFSE